MKIFPKVTLALIGLQVVAIVLLCNTIWVSTKTLWKLKGLGGPFAILVDVEIALIAMSVIFILLCGWIALKLRQIYYRETASQSEGS